MKKFWFMTLVLALALAAPAVAADSDEADNQATTETSATATVASTTMAPAGSGGGAAANDGWHFAITPIAIWGLNWGGSATIAGTTRNINASFSDITDDLSTAGGLGVEIGKGPWAGYLNASFMGWDEDIDNWEAPSGATGDIEFTLDFSSIEAGFMYRLPKGEGKGPTVDLTAGARYTEIEIGAKGTSGFSFDRDENLNWTDPMLGLRVIQPLGKGFNLVAKSAVGGFGFSNNQSQMQWDFLAGVGYHFKFDGWGIGVLAGYKINHFDYSLHDDPQRLSLDLRSQGPMVSATVMF